ncbi:unnamed protein product [Sphenostylis stenocarpa]|uniref:Uncharacterized protein n=1 Tax=Sphenostylis stenocarpa TaxID=92480 RepID=A0AA86TCX3_9FABA|nr:unnamed protein product [Sphenostylis stenocarpa]
MGRGKYKSKPTGRRQFSTPEDLLAGTSNRPRTFKQKEAEHVEEESEEVSGEESEEETSKKKGTQGIIEIENPNLVKPKSVKARDVDVGKTTELSRREREELEKQRAHERYMRLQEQGKTEQARKDLERLALIRQQRAEAAKKREEEKAAKEQKKAEARKYYNSLVLRKAHLTKKLSDLDHLNDQQQLKSINCLSAAEEVIEHLKTEKEELLGQVNDLRTELASLRLQKTDIQRTVRDFWWRKTIKEARFDDVSYSSVVNANAALSEEVEKLQQLRHEGTFRDFNNNSRIMTVDDHTGANVQSGTDLQDSGRGDWLIQVLFEYALGMKLSTYNQTGRICLSALHQSSGYSLRLSWISKSPEEEAELMYHTLSLGTFERVAPEWMREDPMF